MTRDNIHVLSRGVIIDAGQILLCKSLNTEAGFYFLPGGHVEHGEPLEAALCRELMEEESAICKITRFLGCLEYYFEPEHQNICHNHEYNFVFQAESDVLKVHVPLVVPEPHITLMWIPLNQLNAIDLRAEPLKELIPFWLGLSHPSLKSVWAGRCF